MAIINGINPTAACSRAVLSVRPHADCSACIRKTGSFSCVKFLNSYRKGHGTRYNFSCNLQRNSTVERLGKYASSLHFANVSSHVKQSSHLLSVELRCKLHEKLHRVTRP